MSRDPFQPVPEPIPMIDAFLIGGPCAGLRPVPPDNEVVCLDIKTLKRAAYRKSPCDALAQFPDITAYRFIGMRH